MKKLISLFGIGFVLVGFVTTNSEISRLDRPPKYYQEVRLG